MAGKKKRDRRLPKGGPRGIPLTETKKELVRQSFAITNSKMQTGRDCGVSLQTVYNVLAQKPSKEIQRARNIALTALAERVQDKAVEAIDTISQKKLDASSASQLAVIGGILIDKLPSIEHARAEIMASGETSGMPLPEDAAQMMKMLSRKIKSMEILRVELQDPVTEQLAHRAEKLLEDAAQNAIVEAEYEVIDLDNPGGVANEEVDLHREQ